MQSIDSPECEHGWAVFNSNPCPKCVAARKLPTMPDTPTEELAKQLDSVAWAIDTEGGLKSAYTCRRSAARLRALEAENKRLRLIIESRVTYAELEDPAGFARHLERKK